MKGGYILFGLPNFYNSLRYRQSAYLITIIVSNEKGRENRAFRRVNRRICAASL